MKVTELLLLFSLVWSSNAEGFHYFNCISAKAGRLKMNRIEENDGEVWEHSNVPYSLNCVKKCLGEFDLALFAAGDRKTSCVCIRDPDRAFQVRRKATALAIFLVDILSFQIAPADISQDCNVSDLYTCEVCPSGKKDASFAVFCKSGDVCSNLISQFKDELWDPNTTDREEKYKAYNYPKCLDRKYVQTQNLQCHQDHYYPPTHGFEWY